MTCKIEDYKVLVEKISSLITCYKCNLSCNKPIVLPCGHYFCGGCLNTTSTKYQKCPICNSLFKAKQTRTSTIVEDISVAFSKYLITKQLQLQLQPPQRSLANLESAEISNSKGLQIPYNELSLSKTSQDPPSTQHDVQIRSVENTDSAKSVNVGKTSTQHIATDIFDINVNLGSLPEDLSLQNQLSFPPLGVAQQSSCLNHQPQPAQHNNETKSTQHLSYPFNQSESALHLSHPKKRPESSQLISYSNHEPESAQHKNLDDSAQHLRHSNCQPDTVQHMIHPKLSPSHPTQLIHRHTSSDPLLHASRKPAGLNPASLSSHSPIDLNQIIIGDQGSIEPNRTNLSSQSPTDHKLIVLSSSSSIDLTRTSLRSRSLTDLSQTSLRSQSPTGINRTVLNCPSIDVPPTKTYCTLIENSYEDIFEFNSSSSSQYQYLQAFSLHQPLEVENSYPDLDGLKQLLEVDNSYPDLEQPMEEETTYPDLDSFQQPLEKESSNPDSERLPPHLEVGNSDRDLDSLKQPLKLVTSYPDSDSLQILEGHYPGGDQETEATDVTTDQLSERLDDERAHDISHAHSNDTSATVQMSPFSQLIPSQKSNSVTLDRTAFANACRHSFDSVSTDLEIPVQLSHLDTLVDANTLSERHTLPNSDPYTSPANRQQTQTQTQTEWPSPIPSLTLSPTLALTPSQQRSQSHTYTKNARNSSESSAVVVDGTCAAFLGQINKVAHDIEEALECVVSDKTLKCLRDFENFQGQEREFKRTRWGSVDIISGEPSVMGTTDLVCLNSGERSVTNIADPEGLSRDGRGVMNTSDTVGLTNGGGDEMRTTNPLGLSSSGGGIRTYDPEGLSSCGVAMISTADLKYSLQFKHGGMQSSTVVPVISVEHSGLDEVALRDLHICAERGWIDITGQFRETGRPRYRALVMRGEPIGNISCRLRTNPPTQRSPDESLSATGLYVPRTLKYTRALCEGVRVLDCRWLRDSLGQTPFIKMAEPNPYEVCGTTRDRCPRAPYRARSALRDAQGRSSLLSDFDFTLVRLPTDTPVKESKSLPDESTLRWMIDVNGGRVVNTYNYTDWKALTQSSNSSTPLPLRVVPKFQPARRIRLNLTLRRGPKSCYCVGTETGRILTGLEVFSVAWLIDAICNQQATSPTESTRFILADF